MPTYVGRWSLLFRSIWHIPLERFTVQTYVGSRLIDTSPQCWYTLSSVSCCTVLLSCSALSALCSNAYSSNVCPITSDIPVQYSQFGSRFACPLHDTIPAPLEPSTLWQPLHKRSYECLMWVLGSANKIIKNLRQVLGKIKNATSWYWT